MIIFQGQSVFTSFRLQQKLAQLQAIAADVEHLTAKYIYFLQVDESWQDKQLQPLAELLNAAFISTKQLSEQTLLVSLRE